MAVVTVQQFLELVRDAFSTIWGYLGVEPVDEPHHPQNLFKACACIMDALEATLQAVDAGDGTGGARTVRGAGGVAGDGA